MEQRKKRWFKLDNAAKLYPAISNARWSSTFRVSALLYDAIDPKVLQKAVDDVLPRFPSFKVKIKRGFFWYYFEENENRLIVQEDIGHPCMPVHYNQNNAYLVRVLYGKHKINVEVFHALTDGTGALIFLKTLVCQYLTLLSVKVSFNQGALDLKDSPKHIETEDAFKRMPLPKIRASRKESSAYHIKGTKMLPHTLNIVAASMPVDQIMKLAKKYNATITEYIASVMLYAVYKECEKSKKKKAPIRISIPVNMRKYFNTRTLRNFSSYINVPIDPRLGTYTFEEILKTTKAYLQYHNNVKLLSAGISANVQDEQNMFIRLVPLPVKNFIINRIFLSAGDRLTSTTITNLGAVKLPTGSENYIQRFEVLLGPPLSPLCVSAMASCKNELMLIFSDNIVEKTLPRLVLQFLVKQGIEITVESNQEV